MSILYRFRNIARYLSKVVDFNPHHLHSAPSYGVTPSNFTDIFGVRKTKVPGLSCGVDCLIPYLSVLVEHRRVTDTDRNRHRHRRTQGYSIYRASIASRGKNNFIMSFIIIFSTLSLPIAQLSSIVEFVRQQALPLLPVSRSAVISQLPGARWIIRCSIRCLGLTMAQ